MTESKVKALFCDLGGVLLTNGWDHKSRAKAVAKFELNEKEFESRHQLLFGDYEAGKISLSSYLHYTVFYKPRAFSYDLFVEFMQAQSVAFADMIDLIKRLKREYDLKIVIISNEGRDLTNFRIKHFNLHEFVDFFIVSCFIGIRKPDKKIWEMALDCVQVEPQKVVYVDDRQLFVEIASDMGLQAFCHENCEATSAALQNTLNLT